MLINIDIEDSSMVREDAGTTEGREVIQTEEQRLDAEFFLKQLVKEPNIPIETLASEIDPPIPVKTAEGILEDCAKLLVGTVKDADYPERVRSFYNNGANPEDQLTPQDMMTLLDVVANKYHSKLMTKKHADRVGAKMRKMGLPTTREPSEEAMQEVPPNSGVIPPAPTPVTASGQPFPPQTTASGQPSNTVWVATDNRASVPYTPPQPQQSGPQAQQIYENEDSLMKFLLEVNHAINPQQLSKIPYFMMMFRTTKWQWMKNPSKLLMFLKSTFGPVPGETIYVQFMDMKSQVSSDPQNLYRLTGASEYTPLNPVENLMPNMGGMNPMQGMMNMMNESQEGYDGYESARERRMDRLMERMLKAKYMTIMEQMGTNQNANGNNQNQFFNPYEYDVFEDYDKDGRVIAKRYVRKLNPYGQPMTNGENNGGGMTQTMLELFKLMHGQSQAQNNLLLEKVLTNSSGSNNGINDLLQTVLKQTMGAITQQTDPLAQFNRTLDLGERIYQIRNQNQRPQSIEEKKLELDFLLAKKELESAEGKEQREWTRQQQESENANRNVDTVIKEVGGAVKEIAGPILNTVAAAYGRGLAGTGGAPQMDPRMQRPPQPQQVIIQQQPQPQGQPSTISEMMAEEDRRAEASRRAEEEYRARQNMPQGQPQQEYIDNRPVEEQLKDYDDDQLDEMAYRGEVTLQEHERIFNQVMKERARRKGMGVPVPQRKYISPVVNEIAQHEQQRYAQQPTPESIESKYDVFAPEEQDVNMSEPKPSALDTSIPDDERISMSTQEREAMQLSGEIETRREGSSFGTPATENIAPEARDDLEEQLEEVHEESQPEPEKAVVEVIEDEANEEPVYEEVVDES